jgi:hypothetical protein
LSSILIISFSSAERKWPHSFSRPYASYHAYLSKSRHKDVRQVALRMLGTGESENARPHRGYPDRTTSGDDLYTSLALHDLIHRYTWVPVHSALACLGFVMIRSHSLLKSKLLVVARDDCISLTDYGIFPKSWSSWVHCTRPNPEKSSHGHSASSTSHKIPFSVNFTLLFLNEACGITNSHHAPQRSRQDRSLIGSQFSKWE